MSGLKVLDGVGGVCGTLGLLSGGDSVEDAGLLCGVRLILVGSGVSLERVWICC